MAHRFKEGWLCKRSFIPSSARRKVLENLLDFSWGWKLRFAWNPPGTPLGTVKNQPNTTLLLFEEHLARSAADCARVVGVGYSTYQQYRSNRAEMPRATLNHIDVIMRLPLDRLHLLIKDRLSNE